MASTEEIDNSAHEARLNVPEWTSGMDESSTSAPSRATPPLSLRRADVELLEQSEGFNILRQHLDAHYEAE